MKYSARDNTLSSTSTTAPFVKVAHAARAVATPRSAVPKFHHAFEAQGLQKLERSTPLELSASSGGCTTSTCIQAATIIG